MADGDPPRSFSCSASLLSSRSPPKPSCASCSTGCAPGWRPARGPQQGLRSLVNLGLLALLDGLGVFAVWLVCHAAVGRVVRRRHRPGQARGRGADRHLQLAPLRAAVPHRAAARPAGRPASARSSDGDARAMYDRISAVMLLIILGRILYRCSSRIEHANRGDGGLPGDRRAALSRGLRLAGGRARARRRASGSTGLGTVVAAGRPGRPPLDAASASSSSPSWPAPSSTAPSRIGCMSRPRCC